MIREPTVRFAILLIRAVSAVIVPVALPAVRDAASGVLALKLIRRAFRRWTCRLLGASLFVRAFSAVIVSVATPAARDAASGVLAQEFIRSATWA